MTQATDKTLMGWLGLIGEIPDQITVKAQYTLTRRYITGLQGIGKTLQPGQVIVVQRLNGKVFLALEVMIEGTLGHTGALGDFLHPGTVIALEQHHFSAGGENTCAFVLDSVHAQHYTTGHL